MSDEKMSLQDAMDSRRVTVCAECLCASCWLAIFMCENSDIADIKTMTVAELRGLGREHPSYWELPGATVVDDEEG